MEQFKGRITVVQMKVSEGLRHFDNPEFEIDTGRDVLVIYQFGKLKSMIPMVNIQRIDFDETYRA